MKVGEFILSNIEQVKEALSKVGIEDSFTLDFNIPIQTDGTEVYVTLYNGEAVSEIHFSVKIKG